MKQSLVFFTANTSLGPKPIDLIYVRAVSVGLDHRYKAESSHI